MRAYADNKRIIKAERGHIGRIASPQDTDAQNVWYKQTLKGMCCEAFLAACDHERSEHEGFAGAFPASCRPARTHAGRLNSLAPPAVHSLHPSQRSNIVPQFSLWKVRGRWWISSYHPASEMRNHSSVLSLAETTHVDEWEAAEKQLTEHLAFNTVRIDHESRRHNATCLGAQHSITCPCMTHTRTHVARANRYTMRMIAYTCTFRTYIERRHNA